MKVRNVVFIFVLSIILFGPIGLFAIEHMHISLPSWITSKEAGYLEAHTTEANIGSKASFQGFSTGALQKEIEATVAGYIPAKAKAMLANAGLQRASISSSNTLFRWDCYPSFYGSEQVLIPSSSAVADIPTAEHIDVNEIAAFAENLNKVAATVPDKNFVVYITDRSTTSEANPAVTLSSNALATKNAMAAMSEKVTAPNIKLMCDSYANRNDYYEHYCRGDHHWNMKGAAKAFNTMMGSVGLEPIEVPGFFAVGESPSIGSVARTSLTLTEETPIDISLDMGDIGLVKQESGAVENGNAHEEYWASDDEAKKYYFYDLYYNKQYSKVNGVAETGEALVVGDSYCKSLLRLFGLRYKNATWQDALYFGSKSDAKLIDQIEPTTEDIYLIGCAANFSTFNKRNPHYFDLYK